MSAPPKEQPIPMTNLDDLQDQTHANLGKEVAAAGHPGHNTQPAHEEHPLKGTLEELGPYVISGLKEIMVERDPNSRDRLGHSGDVVDVLQEKVGKKVR